MTNTHGGKRPGAGRKAHLAPDEKMQTVALRLPGWMIDKLDSLPGNRSAAVREAIQRYFDEPK